MRLQRVLNIIAVCGLILIMVITILYAAQKVSFGYFTMLLLTGTIIWFIATILSTLNSEKNI